MSMPRGHRHKCEAVQLKILALIEARPGIHADELCRLHYGAGSTHAFYYLREHLRELRGKRMVEARPLWRGGGWWPTAGAL